MAPRLIRWQGDPSLLTEPTIAAALIHGKLPMDLVERLRMFDHNQRISVVVGQSEYTLGPESGFSRTYRWGPRVFDVLMDDADAALLFGEVPGPDGRRNEWDRWQFRDMTDVPEGPRPALTKQQVGAILESFGKLTMRRGLKREYR